MFSKHLIGFCFVILLVGKTLQQSSNSWVSSTANPSTVNLSSSPTGMDFLKSNSSSLIVKSSSFCYSNADCYTQFGYNSRCFSGGCICNIGYYPYASGYCTKINCFTDSDCYTKQYNTACSSGTCTCNSYTYLNTTSQTCLFPNPRTSCTSNYDCTVRSGYNSRCFGRQCICNVGYRSVNGYCTKESCVYDSDCTLTQPNTRCSSGSCVCASNTYLNTSAQTCDSSLQYCSNDAECNARMGYASVCYLGSCKCNLGYQLVNGKCTQKNCFSKSDCTFYWSHTKCDLLDRCTCDYNSLIDTDSQTCIYTDPSSGTSYTGAYVGFPIGFVVLAAFLAACRVACRTGDRRTVVVRSRPRTQARPAATARPRQAPAAQLMQPGYPNSGPYATNQTMQTQNSQSTFHNPNYPPPPGYPDVPPPPYNHGAYQPPPPEALSPYPIASGKM